MSDPTRPLSDAEARRVLARAVELDAQLGSGLQLPELRRAALEAGISAHAFDAAVAEQAMVRAEPVVHPVRVLALDALRRNALATGGFVLLLEVSTVTTRWLGEASLVQHLGMLLAMLGGIRLAHRVRGRLVRDGLIAIGAGQAVVFVFLLAGVTLAQPNVLNWGTLFTGILATLGVRVSRGDRGTPSLGQRARSRVTTVVRRVLPGRAGVEHETMAAPRAVRIAEPRPV